MGSHSPDEERLAERLRRAIQRTFNSSEQIQQILRQINDEGYQMMLAVVVSQVRPVRDRRRRPQFPLSELFSSRDDDHHQEPDEDDALDHPDDLFLTDNDRQFLRSLNLYFPDDDK